MAATATPQAATVAAPTQPPAAAPAAPGGTAKPFAVRMGSARPTANPLAIPAAAAPPATPPKPAAAPDAPAKPAAPAAPAAPTPPPAAAGATPQPPVVGRGGKTVQPATLEDRLARQQRQFWREEYGTDDPVKVQAIRAARKSDLDEFQKLKREQAERDRAQMTREQQLNADLEAEKKARAELQTQLDDMKTGQVVSNQTKQLTEIATKYIDESLVDYVLDDFRRHLTTLAPDEIKRMTPGAINRWFRKFAESKPRFARVATPAPAAATEEQPQTDTAATTTQATPDPKPPARPPVRRMPLISSTKPKGGVPSAKPPVATPQPGTVNGKTYKPGQANSMTSREVKENLRREGRRPW